MKCTDCNGSGVYVGLSHYNERQDCGRCGGSCIEPTGKNGSFPLRDYQQQAVDDILAKRALWTGHAESITRTSVLRISKDQKQFPGRIYLEVSCGLERMHFMDASYNDGKGNVEFKDADTGVHWVLLGSRPGRGSSERWLGWDASQVPRPVILEFAQTNYLALYQRIEMKNDFKCIWHY